MKVSELLQQRRKQWRQLELLCTEVAQNRKSLAARDISRFASLYRAACADLALADEYRLPQNTIDYLHQLVGRAHNQLYRSHRFNVSSWQKTMFVDVPQKIFNDGCVQIAFLAFWGTFLLCTFLAASNTVWPDFAESILPPTHLEAMETAYSMPLKDRSPEDNFRMVGHYIFNNTGIGLKCFASGLLVIPGLVVTTFNAATLGDDVRLFRSARYTSRRTFLRIRNGTRSFRVNGDCVVRRCWIAIGNVVDQDRRTYANEFLAQNSKEAMPLMCAAVVLFFLAALIEAFFSPSSFEGLAMGFQQLGIPFEPYVLKAAMALLCSGSLMFYFVILGYPRET